MLLVLVVGSAGTIYKLPLVVLVVLLLVYDEVMSNI